MERFGKCHAIRKVTCLALSGAEVELAAQVCRRAFLRRARWRLRCCLRRKDQAARATSSHNQRAIRASRPRLWPPSQAQARQRRASASCPLPWWRRLRRTPATLRRLRQTAFSNSPHSVASTGAAEGLCRVKCRTVTGKLESSVLSGMKGEKASSRILSGTAGSAYSIGADGILTAEADLGEAGAVEQVLLIAEFRARTAGARARPEASGASSGSPRGRECRCIG